MIFYHSVKNKKGLFASENNYFLPNSTELQQKKKKIAEIMLPKIEI